MKNILPLEILPGEARALRKARGITLIEMANKIRTSISTLSRFEKGDLNVSFHIVYSYLTELGLIEIGSASSPNSRKTTFSDRELNF